MNSKYHIPSLKRLSAEQIFETNKQETNLPINTNTVVGSEEILDNYGNIIYANTNVHSDISLRNKAKTIFSEESMKYIRDFIIRSPVLRPLVCDIAAEVGRLDILEWAHENNYPWDDTTCESAILNGHLECLRYACENGCPTNNICGDLIEEIQELIDEGLDNDIDIVQVNLCMDYMVNWCDNNYQDGGGIIENNSNYIIESTILSLIIIVSVFLQ